MTGRDVTCPVCGVGPGEQCVLETPDPYTKKRLRIAPDHTERYAHAQHEQDEGMIHAAMAKHVAERGSLVVRGSVDPEHDSIFARFEQLEKLLAEAAGAGSNVAYGLGRIQDAQALVRLLRAQVLK